MKLNLRARIIAAIAQFKADHDIRYYLNGVYAEPGPVGGVVLVATNGHAMGAWLDESGEIERPVILRIGAKLQAACQGAHTKRLVLRDDRLAVLDGNGIELHIQAATETWEVPGKFPDWTRVIKSIESGPSLQSALNPEYVAAMNRAIQVGAGCKSCNVTARQQAAHEGITFTSTTAPNFVGVIMPLRDHDAPVPQWVASAKLRRDHEQLAASTPMPVHEPSDATPPPEYGTDVDPLLTKALEVIVREKKVSISMVQRILGIGYNRAAMLIEALKEYQMIPAGIEGGAA